MCFFCKKFLFFTLLLYTILGFFLLPLLLKPQIIKSVDESLNAHISIENIYFNPFIFKFSLIDVTLLDLEERPLLSFDEFFINIDPSSLFYDALHIKEVSLSSPHIYLNNSKEKGINLLHILKPSDKLQEEKSESSLPRVIIEKVSMIDGSVAIEDRTREKLFNFTVEGIGFMLENIDTQELDTQDAKLRFYSHLGDGGFIDFKANIVGLDPFKVEGSLDFQASQLYTEYRYIQEDLNLEVADGKISFHTLYNFNAADINSTAVKNLKMSLSNLRIKPKNQTRDVLTLKEFFIDDAVVYPFAQEGKIESVGVSQLHIDAKRDTLGIIDWLEFIKVKEKGNTLTNEKNRTTETNNWQFRVDKLVLEKISLLFEDSAVTPAVKTDIREFDFYAKDITLAGKSAISYSVKLDANENFHCQGEGSLIHKKLNLTFNGSCRDLDLVHYKPYIDKAAKESLSVYDVVLQRATAGVAFHLQVEEGENNKTNILLKDTSLTLDGLKVAKRTTSEKLITLKHMGVEGISYESSKSDVEVGLFEIEALKVDAKRYKDGKLNLENLVVAYPEKKKKKSEKSQEKALTFLLKKFLVADTEIVFEDNFLEKRVKNRIQNIAFRANNISLEEGTWFDYRVSMLVNKKGKISSRGKVKHTPLQQKGRFSITNLGLVPLTPYLQESSYVAIEDGRVSLKGKVSYAPSKKSPDVRVESSFLLESLFINNSKDKTTLLSVNDVKTDHFTLELSPNRFYINELDVNSFYVNALIDQNRTMNFQKLMKKGKNTTPSKQKEKSEPFPVKVLKVNVKLGSAKFADYSIPLHFSTHIHNLNGVLYSLSNVKKETTYVDIVGDVNEYGSTSLRGSFDGSDPFLYTDLAFSFKNLDMHSLSGYSASFAGHEIDDGRLYLDLGYEILNSELLGSNSIIMKKVVLGKEIEDENVTILPLGFVFGLLEDSDGVIDIDMPVEGNVDNPDFKYGALVLSTIGGLVAKAVTSPFKFLGKVMGFDAEAIEFVLFEPARTVISPPEREKLDQVYKIMLKKPKISLAIRGSYDEVLDTNTLKIDALINRVMKKSGIKNREDHESAMSTSLLEDIYEDMRDDDYLDRLQEELEKEDSKDFDHRYHNKLLEHCIEIQPIAKSTLLALAESRADAMVNYLVKERGIAASRVIKLVPKSSQSEGGKMVKVLMRIEVK